MRQKQYEDCYSKNNPYLSSKNGTIETKNTTISMSVRKGKTMYNE